MTEADTLPHIKSSTLRETIALKVLFSQVVISYSIPKVLLILIVTVKYTLNTDLKTGSVCKNFPIVLTEQEYRRHKLLLLPL